MTKDELLLELAQQLVCDKRKSPEECMGAWKIGEKYLIRTVTNYWTGRIEFIGPQELKLSDAAWIADTGRFSQALESGVLNEIEPVDDMVIIGRASVIDAQLWRHNLPRKVK